MSAFDLPRRENLNVIKNKFFLSHIWDVYIFSRTNELDTMPIVRIGVNHYVVPTVTRIVIWHYTKITIL